MKKFLSICLVALCSVSAMYAQNDPNSRSNVECGKEVTVKATANDGYHHFVEWEIQNATTPTPTTLGKVAKDGSVSQGNGYGATVSPGVDNGKETSTLSLELGSALIGDAASGTVIFEAVFAEDSYTIIGETNDGSSSSVTGGGTTTGSNKLTLTAQPSACERFVRWEVNGEAIPGATELTYEVTPEESWADGSSHTYTAVFETKKININAKSNDTNMGTVTLTIADPAPAAPQQ